jgi:hypothetical protein
MTRRVLEGLLAWVVLPALSWAVVFIAIRALLPSVK